MPKGFVAAFVVALHLMARARARRTRARWSSPWARARTIQREVQYLDPSQVDPRLGGSQVLPVSFEVRNISSQPVPFDAGTFV